MQKYLTEECFPVKRSRYNVHQHGKIYLTVTHRINDMQNLVFHVTSSGQFFGAIEF